MKSKIVAALALIIVLLSATVVLTPQASASTEETHASTEESSSVSTGEDVALGFAAFAVILMIVAMGAFTHFWGKK